MSRLSSLSRDRWKLLEPLLDTALGLDAAEQSAFLDDACRGDPSLRAELAALVASCNKGDGILGTPAVIAFKPLLSEWEPAPPTLLGGRYHIVREIGRGGMATVYLANDPKHGRQVAVKTLHTEVARIIGRERFAREIEIAAGLSHPHILPLHDSGEEAAERTNEMPVLYFVSPFAGGESLRDRLEREPRLTPNEVVRLSREIALALDYAHRRGVIHLDIKPENILLQEGQAVIADFGIARTMASPDDDSLARTIPILGTPSYMSPEQALRLPGVDGRSDVYSLGCVMYEMITGKRPFERATPAEAVAAARAGATPDVAALHERVSSELASIIMRAMAPAREDRYATAGALEDSLGCLTRARKRRIWRRAAAAIGATVVACALAGLWVSRTGSALDAELVAVAPFDVAAPSLLLWKEGFVDVMSRALDGAGALRAVPASIVVRHWHGRADAQSARELGRATGARLVLFGGLMAAGDSVRATATLLDVKTGRTIAEFDQRDDAGRIDQLSDSLTVAVLRELGRSRRIDMAHATSSPTASLAALKAYLRGEQFYRAALWDSAQMHFESAIDLDSTFALAYHRLASVRMWRDVNDIPDSTSYELMRLPSRFPRGLGPRERLLASIDSLSAEAHFAWRRALKDGTFDHEEALVHRLYATLDEGLRQYPGDPELWFLLGEARMHYEHDVVIGEVDDRAILAPYDRAIALDSAFAPAFLTPISLTAYLEGAASARRYIRAYLSLAPSGPHSQIIRLADALLDPARASSIDVPSLVDTVSADGLCHATFLLRHVPDSAEMIVRIARALSNRVADTVAGNPQRTCAFMHTVNGLQFRGHLRDAGRFVTQRVHWMGPTVLYNMSRAGMVSSDTARAEFQRILALAPRVSMTKLYRWWAADGDTASIIAYIKNFAEQQGRPRSPAGEALLRANVAAGRAYLALAKRDTASALRQLLTTNDTLHDCWHDHRLTTVQLLSAVGRYREAAAHLERRWPGTTACSNGFDDVLWTLERARVFDRVGRREEAAANYAFVVDAWRSADPELQPYVTESRIALARLGGRPPATLAVTTSR